MATTGERIKEARKTAKLSVQQLATKCKVSRSAVYQWEDGTTEPSAVNIFAAAEATGYSAKWLATEKGTKRDVKVLDHAGLDLSFLTATIQAVEKYLDDQDLTLEAEPKAKLVTLLYETCAHKGIVEGPLVARYLRLVA
jgi:transcriptional regulator with XRE-family HTH domain